MKNKVFIFLSGLCVLLLGYIFILAAFIKSPEMFSIPSFIILPSVALVTGIVLGAYYLFKKSGVCISKTFYISCLTIITALPRLVWIIVVNTQPISDFILYHNYAVNASKGIFNIYDITYKLFPFKFGYPLVLSLIYRLFGSDLIYVKVFNVFLSICLALLIYWIGKTMFNETAGRMAGVLFAFWPAQIMYNSVFASEHIYIVFFVFALSLLIKFRQSYSWKKVFSTSALIGISLAIANFIRPVAVIFFPVFIIYLFIFVSYDNNSFVKNLMAKAKFFSLVVLMFVLSFVALTLPLSKIIGVSLWNSSGGYSMMVGTDFKSSGMYSVESEEIIKRFNYDYTKVHEEATKIAINRIKSHPAQFLMLSEKKCIVLWSSEDYGYYWSIAGLSDKIINPHIFNYPRVFQAISQFYYMTLLILTIIGCLYSIKKKNYASATCILVFEGFFAAQTLLEVQSRYHFTAIPFFIIIAGYGIYEFSNNTTIWRSHAKRK